MTTRNRATARPVKLASNIKPDASKIYLTSKSLSEQRLARGTRNFSPLRQSPFSARRIAFITRLTSNVFQDQEFSRTKSFLGPGSRSSWHDFKVMTPFQDRELARNGVIVNFGLKKMIDSIWRGNSNAKHTA
ncbi:hypothetical protein [Neorhodopirellula lusitana]|nr:hypothetical protein [Neorhodopirellula lusitana]